MCCCHFDGMICMNIESKYYGTYGEFCVDCEFAEEIKTVK